VAKTKKNGEGRWLAGVTEVGREQRRTGALRGGGREEENGRGGELWSYTRGGGREGLEGARRARRWQGGQRRYRARRRDAPEALDRGNGRLTGGPDAAIMCFLCFFNFQIDSNNMVM
jgi:hypothetical protein